MAESDKHKRKFHLSTGGMVLSLLISGCCSSKPRNDVVESQSVEKATTERLLVIFVTTKLDRDQNAISFFDDFGSPIAVAIRHSNRLPKKMFEDRKERIFLIDYQHNNKKKRPEDVFVIMSDEPPESDYVRELLGEQPWSAGGTIDAVAIDINDVLKISAQEENGALQQLYPPK